jgi:FkbM family methyltransferase
VVKPRVLVYCGIHEGATLRRLIRRFDVCYGIEADPRLAAEVRRRFAELDKVRIVHAACEQNGSVLFHLHDDRAASSMGRLAESYRRLTGNAIRVVDTVRVPAINLHDFPAGHGVDLIDLYQSDIQGMDFTVPKTLRPLIENRAIRVIRWETERDGHPESS